MGIIRKQSILSSIFIYIGFAIGAINILYIFPVYLKTEEFGLTRLLIDVSMLIGMLATLGACPATLKFYPFYASMLPKEKNDLPFWTVVVCLLGSLAFFIITPWCQGLIIRKFGARSPLFVDYFNLIYPLTISYIFLYLFEAYAWSIQKTVLPNFLKEVVFRLLTTLFVLMLIFKWIDFSSFIHLYAYIWVIPVLILLIMLVRSGQFPINMTVSSVTRRLWKRMVLFSLFVFSGQFLNVVARTADTIVISSQSANGLSDTAVFTIATYLITLMDVPLRGMTGITTSIIARAWKDRDLPMIDRLYKKTALNLLVVGLAIFAIVVLNLHNAVTFLGPDYALLPKIVVIVGLAKIIDLGTGLNSQILLSSKYWKVDFLTNMCFVLFSIPLNIYLVKKYNVIGSSYANLIAYFAFNLTRFFFIRYLFKLQPYTWANLKAIVLATICAAIVWWIPHFDNIFLDAFVRTVAFVLLFGPAVLFFHISDDLSSLFKVAGERMGNLTQRK